MRAVTVGLVVVSFALAFVSAVPYCEQVLPPGHGWGGAVTLTSECIWRPQVHFVSTLTGHLGQPVGAIHAPVITLGTNEVPVSTSGPNRFVITNVILANFSLSDANSASGPYVWPYGLLYPGVQVGLNVPRRLYLRDTQILLNSSSLQQYRRFFEQRGTLVYSDNATFLHIPYWEDHQTHLHNVALLLQPQGVSLAEMAGNKSVGQLNFVVAADQSTLVPLLQYLAGSNTSLPFMVYLSANVTLRAREAVGLPLNRPVYFVGSAWEYTSIDFGMEVNQLALLGTWSYATFSWVVFENLAPGDATSSKFAELYDMTMGYNVWPLLYPRNQNRVTLHNVTLVMSSLEVEEYLFRATLFQVKPAGFHEQLESINANYQEWEVTWLPAVDSVEAFVMVSTAMNVLTCNYTSAPLVWPRLPWPAWANDTQGSGPSAPKHTFTHVDVTGLTPVGTEAGSPGNSEVVLLTTNMSFGEMLPKDAAVEMQLVQHIRQSYAAAPDRQLYLMGIVAPPVVFDTGYAKDFIQLPPEVPPGYLTIVDVVLQHLAQGPKAPEPGASILTPDVWTMLLWGIPRPTHSIVLLSNVTMWVPAGEFSYIRSFVRASESASNFSIDLQAGQTMRFSNVQDLRAEGLYIQHFAGPGIEADSLQLRMEPGWSQDGPPKGFWATGAPAGDSGGNMSDVTVVVLSVCLVTAVVAGVLGLLAIVLWRRRTAEARATAAAALHAGKPGDVPLSSDTGSGHDGSNVSGPQGPSDLLGSSKRLAASGQAQELALSCEPVHDSSDSYHLQNRAQLTAELARNQFGVNRLMAKEGSDHSDATNGGGRAAQQQQMQGLGRASAASDACLQRLHSAITSMSQDVLSRRLQVSNSNNIANGVSGTVAAQTLGRPSPIGDAGQQQQQQHLTNAEGAVHSGSDALASAADSLNIEDAAAVDGTVGNGAAAAAAAGALLRAHAAHAGAAATPAVPPGTVLNGEGSIGELKLLQLVGQGTFGQVYKALWRRRCVAVKVLQLPATAGSSDIAPWMGVGRASSHREKMAVMETVVSTTMSHPNIVQVFTYVLQPLLNGQGRLINSASRTNVASSPLGSSCDGAGNQQQQQQQQPEQQWDPSPPQQQHQQQPEQQVKMQQMQQQLQSPAAACLEQPQHQHEQQDAPQGALHHMDDSPQQQQQQMGQPFQQESPSSHTRNSGELRRKGSHLGTCDDNSHSVNTLGEVAKLTPEMAAAAAAALPAAAGGDGSGLHQGVGSGVGCSSVAQEPVLVGWELRLVMEFCDAGSLRTALDHKLLIDRTTGLPALECVLFLAHDVACAMIHLHSEHLLHGDLKASNVLLKRTAPRLPVSDQTSSRCRAPGHLIGQGLGLMAKVADFGLSLTLNPADTHVSQMHMGTLTHMAPELLLHGRASRASDVYAYGILLWELATGLRPYSGTPVGMLAHKVAQQGWRPAWPGGYSLPVQMLVEACWAQDVAARPNFEQIVQQLEDMASQLDTLKQQQAQQMAAAAEALCQSSTGAHDPDIAGHELTPSMMADLMPSGFSAGSKNSEELQSSDPGVVYEMSQLSGWSQDRETPALAGPARGLTTNGVVGPLSDVL